MSTAKYPQSLLIATLAAFMAGCATTAPKDAPQFTPAPAAPPGYATVYVYRFGELPNGQDINVSLANKQLFSAREQGYTWAHVRAGTHTFIARWPKGIAGGAWPDASSTQLFEEGQSYYFRLRGTMRVAGGGFFSSGGWVMITGIVRRTSDDGKAELLACCRYVRAETERID
jgi:hypothetical protein